MERLYIIGMEIESVSFKNIVHYFLKYIFMTSHFFYIVIHLKFALPTIRLNITNLLSLA